VPRARRDVRDRGQLWRVSHTCKRAALFFFFLSFVLLLLLLWWLSRCFPCL
jgi:hypothetical protein